MRIIVDQMPITPIQCPYCSIDYTCTWYNSNIICKDTKECPYFKAENKVTNSKYKVKKD